MKFTNSKFLRAIVIGVSGLTLGMLSLTPNVHGTSAYEQGYRDGQGAGRKAARDDAPPDENYGQNSGSACCGGQQQQPQQNNR